MAAGCPRAASEDSLTVFAAASLRGAFTTLGERFTARTGTPVAFNFAGSQELSAQLENGADADVVALADERHLAPLRTAGLVDGAVPFAANELVVVAPRGTLRPATFEELPEVDRLVLGAHEVPIGGYSEAVLDAAGADFKARVLARVRSREPNVKLVLAKVMLGEADAAMVYRSEALEAGKQVRVVEIPPRLNVAGRYPVAVPKASKRQARAQAFVAFLRSPEGQAVLASAGFLPPGGP